MFANRGTMYVLLLKKVYLNSYLFMTIYMKVFFTTLLISLSALSFAQTKQTMPEVILKDLNGNNKNAADYSKTGKITIISFWATWCTPCKKELSNIHEIYDEWQEKYGLELVAVTVDNSRNVPKVKPYVSGQGWEYDVLLDVNSDLARALNVLAPPQTFLLDQNGNIVYSHLGYTEGDEFVLEEKIKALMPAKK